MRRHAAGGGMKMDAATLYTVMAVASGPKRMSTEQFPTMAICERAADKLRKKTPFSVKATYYCVKRKVDAPSRVASPQKAADAGRARRTGRTAARLLHRHHREAVTRSSTPPLSAGPAHR